MRFCLLVSILVLLSLMGSARPATSTPAPRPNILLIISDDQRADFAEDEAVMPALRRYLAQNGTRFESAYATTPLCCPARAAIMTGQYAHNNGVGTNLDTGKLDHTTTLQAKLGESGYVAGYVGKYLNRWDLTIPPPYFDWWATAKYPNQQHDNSHWNVNGELLTDERYGSVATGHRARQFLRWAEEQDDAPWFLIVSFFEPHSLFVPEERYKDAKVVPPDVPAVGIGKATRQLRMLMSVDDAVQRIFSEMDALEEKPDTLVVYISDNGLILGERGMLNTKGLPYKPSVHVPLYLRWPGQVARGDVRRDLVANIDIAPTVLQAAGLPTDGIDGKSLLTPAYRELLLLEWLGVSSWASLVSPAWQYIDYHGADYQYEGSVPPPAGLADELDAVRDCAESACP